MRAVKQAALVLSVILLLPLAASTVAARPPSGFVPVSVAEFTPVIVPARDGLTYEVEPSATPPPPVIYERAVDRPVPTLAKRQQPEAVAESVSKATPRPVLRASASGRSRSGLATWYCRAGVSVCHFQYPDRPGCDRDDGSNCDDYAAAGPALRVGDWRGRVVQVCSHGGNRCLAVKLVDWCACMNGESGRIIDLYWDPFDYLSDGRGGESVTVSW